MKEAIKEKPKVDVVYVRVSSNEQVLGFSLDNQEKHCNAFSEKDKHCVLKILDKRERVQRQQIGLSFN